MHGTIDRLEEGRGFGFIIDDDRREYFFQSGSLIGVVFEDLAPGVGVEFTPRPPESGDKPGEHPRAVSVRLAENAALAPDHERLSARKTA